MRHVGQILFGYAIMPTRTRHSGTSGVEAGRIRWLRTLGRHLARHVVAVAGLVVVVVLVAIWLRPAGEAGDAPPAAAAEAPVASARPEAGDLTLAWPAGQVLVGLTVRPAEPGPNDLLVFLLPLEGEEAAEPLEVTLDVGGEPVATQRCGPSCRQATATLGGGETVGVTVAGTPAGSSVAEAGGTTAFTLPQLPAADGGELLTQAHERMHQLDTVAIVEKFSIDDTFPPPGDRTEADYEYQAPDRMRVVTGAGAETLHVASVRYRRDTSEEPWDVERSARSFESPGYAWDYFLPAVAPTIIGSEDIDGQPTQIVAFAGRSDNIPVWFRLWVDADGLVRQATMHAQAHFMHHSFHSFDAPIAITPPANAPAPAPAD